MTSKERLYNAIAGKKVDRTPYAPLLTYWWELQPQEVRAKGEVAMYRTLGAEPLIRGHYPTGETVPKYRDLYMVDINYRDCEISETIHGQEKMIIYQTPVGELMCKYRTDPISDTWFLVEHPVKNSRDLATLQFIMENAELTPNFSDYESIVREYGDEVLAVPILVPGSKTAFQSMIEYWVGTVDMIYMLEDEPELVEQTLAAIRAVNRKSCEICAQSSAEVFLTWEDSSTTNYSPKMYEKYIFPEINEWCDILHKEKKLYIQHACGHLKALLPIIAKSKIDCLESITPSPTGDVTMAEVVATLPSRISLVGGIDPMVLLNADWNTLEQYTKELLHTMKGRSFILSNSDSCPPGVKLEHLQKLAYS